VLVERDAPCVGAVTLTLNRPEKRNALSIEVRDAISDALDVLAADETVKCAVITGAGDVFSAGFDLKEFENTEPAFVDALWASSDRFHSTVIRFPLPLVAALNGPALAGGFDLAIMCDIRIAADTVRFAHPEQKWSDVVYAPLHDLVGGAVARDLCMIGRLVEADEALRLHLVSAVVPRADLEVATATAVEQICAAPRANLLRTKAKALRRAGQLGDTGPTLDL